MSTEMVLDQEARQQAEELIRTRPYTLGFVRVSEVHWDFAYQREPKEGKITEIARDWDSLKQGVLIVNRREDGSIYVCDGGHRTKAALRRHGPDYSYPAQIFDRLAVREEATIFAGINGHRAPVSSLLRYRSEWLSGDPDLHAVTDILRELAIEWTWTGSAAPRTTHCFGALVQILRRRSADHLRLVLSLIIEAWEGEHASMEGQYILGVSRFIVNHSKEDAWEWKEVVRSLGHVSAEQIALRAGVIRTALPHENRSGQHAIYKALHEAYNKSRRSRRLSQPKNR